MKKQKAIIVFVKYPEHGKVKTRLAATTSNNFAVKFYKLISANIFKELSLLNKEVKVFIYYPEVNNKTKIKEWVANDFTYALQKGINLGEKMNNAFSDVFDKGNNSVIIIGTDIPDLNSQFISNAFDELENNELVIAPSNDGGYSLLGMNKIYPVLFNKIKWSSSSVYDSTLNKIKQYKLKYKNLNTIIDIDTKDDLNLWITTTKSTLKNKVKKLALEEGIKL